MFGLKIISFFFICLLADCGNIVTQPANSNQTRLPERGSPLEPANRPENAGYPGQPQEANLSLYMERSMCYGTCPVYKLNFQPGGKVIFEGIKFTQVMGKTEGALNEEKIKQLIAEIDNSNFFLLKDNYTESSGNCPETSTDSPTVIISVKLRGKEKEIVHYHGCEGNPDTKQLSNLENKIDAIVDTKQWIGEKK